MKTVEIFIDESGDIRRHRPMNITGIAVLAPSEEARDGFHSSYLEKLRAEGLTSGVCDAFAPNSGDNPGRIAEAVVMPDQFIVKRPDENEWEAFWETIHRMAQIAEECAKTNRTDLMAFSLQFPSSTNRRWGTSDAALNQLLDRPYSECLKDILEMLLFETPRIRQAITGEEGCSLSFDLPTRNRDALLGEENPDAKVTEAWTNWGLDAWAETDNFGQSKVIAPTLEAGDAIEILTTALNRRASESEQITVGRSRCCKLVNWAEWERVWVSDESKRLRWRHRAIASSPRPKQIHFLADYVSNGIFNDCIQLNIAPYRAWFDRGFVLSSVDDEADRWLSAVRAFANGDRVEALKVVNDLRKKPKHQQTKTHHFFRRAAQGWPEALTAQDLKRLFVEVE